MDIMGPISMVNFEEEVGTVYLLAVVDRHTRYITISILREITTKRVIQSFEKAWLKRIGTPKTVLTDQGRQFVSQELREYLKAKDIKLIHTTAYNPQGNGIVERANQEIGKGLRLTKYMRIKEAVRKVEFGINNTVNRSTGYAPAEAFYGTNAVFPLSPSEDLTTISKKINQKIRKAMEKKKMTDLPIYPGENVWLRTQGQADKLGSKWVGPVPVIKQHKNDSVIVVDLGYKEWAVNKRNVRKVVSTEGVDVVPSTSSQQRDNLSL